MNEINGRDRGGKFTTGNKFSNGNPMAKHAHALRKALYAAVTPEDIEVAIRSLVDQARSGNVVACRELLDRVLGKPEPIDILERLEELEVALERATRRSA